MMQPESRPIIGIVPSFDDGTTIPAGGGDVKRIYLRHEYMNMLASVGAVPLVLNPSMPLESIVALCDGIVISGGEDINPQFYEQQRLAQVKRVEPTERFDWESELIKACDKAAMPILGICYGMQRLNVHYGGTLMQDIPSLLPDNVGHDNTKHHVTFLEDFLGMRSQIVHEVSSRHHQAIARLADGFRICAKADDDIIEAIEGRGHYGMQWHPESDETGAHVYRVFVERCLEANSMRV
jgi:putative glutamine amidotransferase